jgi:cullin 3
MTRGNDLYGHVQGWEQQWLEDEVRKRVTAAISPVLLLGKDPADVQDQANERRAAGEKFLEIMRELWEDHQLCMGMITDVLMYMVSLHCIRCCTSAAD